MHLVGFIIRIYHDAWSLESQIRNIHYMQLSVAKFKVEGGSNTYTDCGYKKPSEYYIYIILILAVDISYIKNGEKSVSMFSKRFCSRTPFGFEQQPRTLRSFLA